MESFIIDRRGDQTALIILVCAGAFIANLDATIVNIALPSISRELRISPSAVSWVVLSYLLFEASLMLPFGKLADVRGIKGVYLVGFVVFLVGSLLCGISANIEQLVVFRALQGIGGAMLFTVMMAFISIYLPPERRIKAMGLATTAAAAGVGFGPPVGGWITTLVGWRWIFFVNIPFCLAAILAVRIYMPAASPRPAIKRFDYAGAAYSFAAFALFLFGINMGRELGWTSASIVCSLALSLILTACFVRREMHIDYPLMDLRIFRNKIILFGMLAFSASLMTVGGVLFIFPFYLQDFRYLDAHVAGMIMMLLSIGQFIGPYSGRLTDRFGVVHVCLAGLVLGLFSFILFLHLGPQTSLLFIILALGLFGLSQGIGKAPNTALIMASAPLDAKGAVSSIMSLARSLSIALGVLFFETIFSDSIPHRISLENTHIASGITHLNELVPGFLNDFHFGIVISALATFFMFVIRKQTSSRNG